MNDEESALNRLILLLKIYEKIMKRGEQFTNQNINEICITLQDLIKKILQSMVPNIDYQNITVNINIPEIIEVSDDNNHNNNNVEK